MAAGGSGPDLAVPLGTRPVSEHELPPSRRVLKVYFSTSLLPGSALMLQDSAQDSECAGQSCGRLEQRRERENVGLLCGEPGQPVGPEWQAEKGWNSFHGKD